MEKKNNIITMYLLEKWMLEWWNGKTQNTTRTLFYVSCTKQICVLCIFKLCLDENSASAANTEERTQFLSSGYSPKWRLGEAEEINLNKVFFFFYTKIILVAS